MQKQKKQPLQQKPSEEQIILFLIDYRRRSGMAFLALLWAFISGGMMIYSLLSGAGLLTGFIWLLMACTSSILGGNINPSPEETKMAKHYVDQIQKK